jgi:isocitrate lyase
MTAGDPASEPNPAKTGRRQPGPLEGHRPRLHAADVVRLRGSVHVEHTLARLGAEKLWR